MNTTSNSHRKPSSKSNLIQIEWVATCDHCGYDIPGNKVYYCRNHKESGQRSFEVGFYHKECMLYLKLSPIDPNQIPRLIEKKKEESKNHGYFVVYLTEAELESFREQFPNIQIWRGSVTPLAPEIDAETRKMILDANKRILQERMYPDDKRK